MKTHFCKGNIDEHFGHIGQLIIIRFKYFLSLRCKSAISSGGVFNALKTWLYSTKFSTSIKEFILLLNYLGDYQECLQTQSLNVNNVTLFIEPD